jgi:tetratricopeptide (TPR) repeat protein
VFVNQRAKIRLAGLSLAAVFLLIASVGFSTPDDEERTALQNTIELGDDLSPRAQKVLFSSRTRQDEGRFDEAAKVMAAWIDDHPDHPHHLLHFNLAVSLMNLDQTQKALENLERAVALEPRFARGWLRLGEAAYGYQQYARAAEAFLRGYELMSDPQAEILYYSAVAWLLDEQPARAMDGIVRLLRDNRQGAPLDWYQVMVAAAVETEEFAAARPWVENCLVDNESDPDAWYLAYQLAVAQEDYEQGAVWLTVVSYLRPLTRDELLQLGNLFAGSGTPLQAARYYQQAFEYPETETTADDYVRLASAWMAAHQLEEARGVLDQGVAAAPTVRLLALLGDLEYSEENYTTAREVFDRCVAMDPEYGRGWLMSGYCSVELGDNAKARSHLLKAAEFPKQAKAARELLERIP